MVPPRCFCYPSNHTFTSSANLSSISRRYFSFFPAATSIGAYASRPLMLYINGTSPKWHLYSSTKVRIPFCMCHIPSTLASQDPKTGSQDFSPVPTRNPLKPVIPLLNARLLIYQKIIDFCFHRMLISFPARL